MSTFQDLQKRCEQIRAEYKGYREDVEQILSAYLEKEFIEAHKPFRAVDGNKKCVPIPIYKRFSVSKKDRPPYVEKYLYYWPNVDDRKIKQAIKNLGFLVEENPLSISVPPYQKGEKMTFAQKWVIKINHSYSEFVVREKSKANEYCDKVISDLVKYPDEKITVYNDSILFKDYKIQFNVSKECMRFIRKNLKEKGIEELFEKNAYKGMIVKNNPNS